VSHITVSETIEKQYETVSKIIFTRNQRIREICDSSCSLGRAPMILSIIFPSFTRNMVGILEIEYLEPMPGFSSTLSLAILSLVLYLAASSSKTGPTALHGPHQGAQQSNSTGSAEPITSRSKELSVTLTGRLKLSIGNRLPHFPHFGFSFNRDTGTLFFPLHFEHASIKLFAFIIVFLTQINLAQIN
jgi:hypothetical protein